MFNMEDKDAIILQLKQENAELKEENQELRKVIEELNHRITDREEKLRLNLKFFKTILIRSISQERATFPRQKRAKKKTRLF